MKTYIINAFITKGKKSDRKNFDIKSASKLEADLKTLILEKLEIDSEKWELESDSFELVERESVIIYKSTFKEKENKE